MFPQLPDLLRWRMLDGSGWQYLLPRPPYSSLLCYDALDGATMLLAASLARDVCVVHHDPDELRRLEATAAAAGLQGLRFELFAARPGASSASGGGGFDAALLHDPGARLLRRDHGAAPDLDAIVGALASAVQPAGFLYVGLRNRFGYGRLRERRQHGPRLLSLRAVTRALGRAGFTSQRVHAYLCEGTRVEELVPDTGYRSGKNRFLMTERLREVALRGWGLRRIAPAYGVVASRNGARSSWLDGLIADPWVRSLAPERAVRRSLVLNNGKLVLSLGRTDARHGSLILVLAPDAMAARRRREEARWLQKLAAIPAPPARAVPVFHGEREIDGVPVFALSELPGVTVDHDTPLLPRFTGAAARWLRELHAGTARPTEMTPQAMDELLGPSFAGARRRYPGLGAELAGVEQAIRARLAGRELPLVFMHGDFKLENVIFDEDDGRLRGVIDWELAQHPGPPLLDLLYLLFYDRIVRRRSAPLAALAAAGLQEWTDEERAQLDAYHAVLDCRGVERPLAALFVVHHIGLRTVYASEANLRQLRTLLSALAESPAERAS